MTINENGNLELKLKHHASNIRVTASRRGRIVVFFTSIDMSLKSIFELATLKLNDNL